MAAEIIWIDPEAPDPGNVGRAARALAEGALVAFPTETVYGLAASASDAASVDRLRAVKGREASQPFTVHIGRAEDCDAFIPSISSLGKRFIRKGWPGPLTLVFEVSDSSAAAIRPRLCESGVEAIYGRSSAGIRFPDHRVAAMLLNESGVPVIASSANPSGRPAAVDSHEVAASVGDVVDVIVDSGVTRYRKGSTIVELNGQGYRLLREGVWDERTVRRMSTLNILIVCTGNTCRSPIAEGLCRKQLAERLGCGMEELASRGIQVLSAGMLAQSGGRASDGAMEVCRRRGVDLSHHVSQPLTMEMVRSADFIFGMTENHLDAVRELSPHVGSKLRPLSDSGDISDPMGGPMEAYERAARAIEAGLKTRLSEVTV